MRDIHELLTAKELANELKRSISYVRAMKRKGFKMPGHRATIGSAILWLADNPEPCRKSN